MKYLTVILLLTSGCAWRGTTAQGISFSGPSTACHPANNALDCADTLSQVILASEKAFEDKTGIKVKKEHYKHLKEILLTLTYIVHSEPTSDGHVNVKKAGLHYRESGQSTIYVFSGSKCMARTSLSHELMHYYDRVILNNKGDSEDSHNDSRLFGPHSASEIARYYAESKVCKGGHHAYPR